MRARRALGRGKGRWLLPHWKGFQPYRCFITHSKRGNDLLGRLCFSSPCRRHEMCHGRGVTSPLQKAVGDKAAAPKQELHPGPGGDSRAGQCPPRAVNHRRVPKVEQNQHWRASRATKHQRVPRFPSHSSITNCAPSIWVPAKLGARAPPQTLQHEFPNPRQTAAKVHGV